MTDDAAQRHLRKLSTPRAAALAGVLFALLFGTALILIRTALPERPSVGVAVGRRAAGKIQRRGDADAVRGDRVPVVHRRGARRLRQLEDKFFSSVFIGSGLLFLAMMFAASAVGAGAVASHAFATDAAAHAEVVGVRPGDADDAEQDLRAADGGGVHDVAGHHLAEDAADAALAGAGDLPCRAGAAGRRATSACGSRWPSRSGCWWSACCCWSGRGDRPDPATTHDVSVRCSTDAGHSLDRLAGVVLLGLRHVLGEQHHDAVVVLIEQRAPRSSRSCPRRCSRRGRLRVSCVTHHLTANDRSP